MTKKPSSLFIISLLGALSVISPFSIDLYLPAFTQASRELGVTEATFALTISSYFIGLALGQVFYGPLLDRYGRRAPLLGGLVIFILASAGCAIAPDIDSLIALRFIQAIGGCAAGVASLAIVHDFFPIEDAAKILSRLFLFIAVSPLLAPSIGGMVALSLGWRSLFYILAAVTAAIFVLIYFKLPESHAPDKSISLKPGPIVREYFAILCHPRFITYALSGAFSFAGLFAYVAGSPIIFMEGFQLSQKAFSGLFALLATGFICSSQINASLLRRWKSEQIFRFFVIAQTAISLVFVLGMTSGWFGFYSTLALFFVFLASAGLTYPNAAAIALSPFTKNAGSAAALLGFLQLGIGALISTGITALDAHSASPIILILAVTSTMGLVVLLMGQKRAHAAVKE